MKNSLVKQIADLKIFKANMIDQDLCSEYFFPLVDEYFRASSDTIETLEKYFLSERVQIFDISKDVFENARIILDEKVKLPKPYIQRVQSLSAKNVCLFLFPDVIEPINGEGVLQLDDEHDSEELKRAWLDIDGLLVAYDNYKDYSIKTFKEGFEELDGKEHLEGCFTIIPLNKIRSVLGSNHNWNLTINFGQGYHVDERETYGNLFDLAQYLFCEIQLGRYNKNERIDSLGNCVQVITMPPIQS